MALLYEAFTSKISIWEIKAENLNNKCLKLFLFPIKIKFGFGFSNILEILIILSILLLLKGIKLVFLISFSL